MLVGLLAVALDEDLERAVTKERRFCMTRDARADGGAGKSISGITLATDSSLVWDGSCSMGSVVRCCSSPSARGMREGSAASRSGIRWPQTNVFRFSNSPSKTANFLVDRSLASSSSLILVVCASRTGASLAKMQDLA